MTCIRPCDDRLTADCESVAALTERFVCVSARYRAAGSRECAFADTALARTTGALRPQAVDAYKAGVADLARAGWLNPAQVAILVAFANAL
jgi:hypothetical protein